jgi:glycosyltransferase involved in cell wall biosynthesis
MRLLRLMNEVGIGAPYDQYSVQAPSALDITILTYFPHDGSVDPRLEFIPGDGTIWGYVKRLHAVLCDETFEVVHAHSCHVGALYALVAILSPQRRIPSVFTMHTSYPNYRPYHKILLVLVFATFDQIICCGQSSLESVPRFFKLLARGKLDAIANGVDVETVGSKAERGNQRESARRFTTIMVCRLIDSKNCDVAIRAFCRGASKSARMVIVGDGPRRLALEGLVNELGASDRVQFVGLRSRDNVYRLLGSADLFISTSRVEGLPNAVLEAMAAGCPLTLSNIPPHREVAGEDLLDPNDTMGFAESIRRIEALTAEERVALGRRCQTRVVQRFSLGEMHERYTSVFEKVAQCRSPNHVTVGS